MIKSNLTNLKTLLCLIALGILSSCSSLKVSKQQVLRHVVFLKFEEGVSEEQKAMASQRFLDLKGKIPEIKKMEGGLNINTSGMNKEFTHCFVLTFESEAARDIYLPHPAHVEVVEKNKPLLNDLLVVDYWGME